MIKTQINDMNLGMLKLTPKRVEKDWGYELWLANDEDLNICTKILFVQKLKKFSMHFHDKKREYFYVHSGNCFLRILDTSLNNPDVASIRLVAGDSFFIDRLVPHQIEAIQDTEIIETSTFHKDEDSFRVWR